jgi:plastocyanin
MRMTLLLVFLMAIAVMACGEESKTGDSTDASIVEIREYGFEPSLLIISAGDSVRWVNITNNEHTIKSGQGCDHDGLWSSGVLSFSATFTWTFENPGTFFYFSLYGCDSMTGSVKVNP